MELVDGRRLVAWSSASTPGSEGSSARVTVNIRPHHGGERSEFVTSDVESLRDTDTGRLLYRRGTVDST